MKIKVAEVVVALALAIAASSFVRAGEAPKPGSTVLAQDDVRARGDRACRSDVVRLCREVADQGDAAVLRCLQTNQERLSRVCHKFLVEVGQVQPR